MSIIGFGETYGGINLAEMQRRRQEND